MGKTKMEWTDYSWRIIKENSTYLISSCGDVFSLKTNRMLHPMASKSGHLYVFLYNGHGKSRKMWIHRLVLEAFVGACPMGCECRHLDGNPLNNNFANLCWGTRKENIDDKIRHGRMPMPHQARDTKLVPEDIGEIRNLFQNGWSSRRIAIAFSTSHTTIQKIIRGERWKGY